MKRSNTTFSKNIQLSIAVLILTTLNLSLTAQDKNFHFGLKLVPGVYWIGSTTDGVKPNGAAFGFGYGAVLEFGFTENYSLVTGLDLVSTGVKAMQQTTIGTLTITAASQSDLQYLQIPLFLKMKTKAIGMIKYYGQFGLGSGFALSTKNSSTVTNSANSSSSSSSDSKMGNIFPIRESLLIGLGLEYNISGSTSLVGGITYDNGFTPVYQGKDANNKDYPSLTSKGITFTIGILF